MEETRITVLVPHPAYTIPAMAIRSRVVLVVGLLIGACATGHVDTTMPLSRPEPSLPATGPTVARLAIGETMFSLHAEGSGCLALAIDQPGLQSTVGRDCFAGERVLEISDPCGWLTSDKPPTACDVTLPIVLYGHVREPGIGYVCVGSIGSSVGNDEVVSARLLPFDGDGFILEEAHPGEIRTAHLFTAGGLRYGEPPLDAPSDSIYRRCEELAPWGPTEAEIPVALDIELGESLQTSSIIMWLDAGTGPFGHSGASAEDGVVLGFPLRVASSSPGLVIRIDSDGAEPTDAEVVWPDAFQAVLDADAPCPMGARLRLTIGDAALTGTESAITLELLTSTCSP